MVVVELTYTKSLDDDVDAALEAHRTFLQKYYDQGTFIASGPKNPRDGGVILAHIDKATMSELIKEDPFFQQQIAEYKITEFETKMMSVAFSSIFSKL